MHSTDLSKVPHRYAVMLTIHTRLVHPHPFVTERAAMFYKRVCHFRTKPRRYPVPDKKFRSCRVCINYQTSIENLRLVPQWFYEQEIAFLGSRGNPVPLDANHWTPTAVSLLSRGFKLLLQLPLRVRRYRGVFNSNDFAPLDLTFLANVRRLETICVHPYDGILPSPTNYITFQPFLSLCLTHSLSTDRIERSKKCCDREDMHSADLHSLPFSYTIDSSFERERRILPLPC